MTPNASSSLTAVSTASLWLARISFSRNARSAAAIGRPPARHALSRLLLSWWQVFHSPRAATAKQTPEPPSIHALSLQQPRTCPKSGRLGDPSPPLGGSDTASSGSWSHPNSVNQQGECTLRSWPYCFRVNLGARD